MNKRKWIITTSSVMLVLLLISGYMAIAAEYGSESDPLVSASYITDVLAPETIKEVNATIEQKTVQFQTQLNQTLAEYTATLDATISEFEAQNQNLAENDEFISAVATQVLALMNGSTDGTDSDSEGVGTPVTGGSTVWRMIEIEKGQTLVFEVGGMILPRIGSATCFSPSSPGLINVTTGSELSAGGTLSTNNLYIVTVAGRGFTATASTNKFLVAGNYTIK
ncbi:MAG: hypothetical protein VB111_03865 [Clostridiaceae bacterium]|nr:hypothetical protein [Clostridiaceae bacterium]